MTLKMICFNGFNWTVMKDATQKDLSDLVKKRRKQGYECMYLSPKEVEINHETCLVNDFMGYAKLVKND